MKEYKRLTERRNGIVIDKCGNCKNVNNPQGCTDKKCYEIMKNRLADLEDKIENGTLIELPCKVGDKVYCIYHFDGWFEEDDMEYDIIPEEVVDIIIKEEDFDIGTSCRMIGKFQRVCVCFSIAEAEEKLKELQK